MRPIDRRTFLALGLGAVVWSCSRGKPKSTGGEALSIVATAQTGLAKGDTRNGIAVFRGQTPIVPKDLKVQLLGPSGSPFGVDVRREHIKFGAGGSEPTTAVTDIFVFRHDFGPGVWQIKTTVEGQELGVAVFQIDPKSPSPAVGGRAIPSPSPTTANARGVDPICTRTPPCSMHDVSIADALLRRKPIVVIFGTPRFCTSRTCGPDVDLIEDQKKRVGSKASFVHVEVFRNSEVALKENGDSPTFAEWKLATEPWTYFIGANGVIKDRWLGAMGSDELQRAVDALAG
jgi:hypothetical protein